MGDFIWICVYFHGLLLRFVFKKNKLISLFYAFVPSVRTLSAPSTSGCPDVITCKDWSPQQDPLCYIFAGRKYRDVYFMAQTLDRQNEHAVNFLAEMSLAVL